MATSLYKKVGLASLIMSASILASRIIGLVREMVIAHVGGATGIVDAYQVSFVIPEILNHVVASGFLSITFIPIFANYLAQGREDEGWRVFSIVMTHFGLLLLVLIGVAVIFADGLVTLLAPGLTEAPLKAAAVRMTRVIIPAQFFFFTGGLFTAVQFAKERFALPALAPLVYNLGIIIGGLALGPLIGMEAFSWGVLVGAFVGNFALQFIGARRVGMPLYVNLDWRHPALRTYIKLTLPLMLGLTMMFSTEIFLKFFGSYLDRGGIAGLNYGLRIMLMLVAFFGQAVGVASFPYLARLAAEKKITDMARLLDDTLRYLTLVIPLAVCVMVLRREVVAVLFQHGRFDAAATEMTAGLLVYLLLGAFAFAAQTVVVRGFYALQNTLFPAIFSTLGVIVSLPFFIAGTHFLGTQGVALAISISATLQVFLLYGLWNRRIANPHGWQLIRFIGKVTLITIPLGVLCECLRIDLSIFLSGSLIGSLTMIAVISVIFGAMFIAAAYAFKINELRHVVGVLKSRIRR